MTIYVSNLSDLETHTRAVRPERLISIIQPELQPPTPAGVAPQRHLRVPVHDVSEPAFESILPERRHVETIVAFLRDWSADDSLMVHCLAGVSRSSAVALIHVVSGRPACRPPVIQTPAGRLAIENGFRYRDAA